MKTVRIIIVAVVVVGVLAGGLYFFYLSPRYVVPILMYHRFGYAEGSSLYVTPENFKKQLAYLKSRHYNVISLDELVTGIIRDKEFPHNTVVITIDDGYQDNYTYAYPLLKKYGFPAIIFLEAGRISTREGYLTWEEVREMLAGGIAFGAHTVNGAYLPSLKDEHELWYEISAPRGMILEVTGVDADYFCYPIGGFTDKAKELVKLARYKGACTTNRGFAELNKDVFELKRIKVKNTDTNKPLSFRAKLSGYYNLFRSRKPGH